MARLCLMEKICAKDDGTLEIGSPFGAQCLMFDSDPPLIIYKEQKPMVISYYCTGIFACQIVGKECNIKFLQIIDKLSVYGTKIE